MSRCAVIGGGASGMMAAIAAASIGHEVTLFEKNEKLGKKIYITGKGRCNFTNACEIEDLIKNIVSNPKFMYSALYTFSNASVMQYMEDHGTPYKIERGNRVFPQSDHASDVTKALERGLKENHVKVCLHAEVEKVLWNDTEGDFFLRVKGQGQLAFDSCIICTGGLSYATTGSTGDGYRFAKNLGHQVTDTYPALVPFITEESDIYELSGLSLKNVSLTIFDSKKKLYSEFGEMLFTHFGISGPLVLSASSQCVKKLHEKGRLSAEIDLKSALDYDKLEKRILREIDANPNKNIKSILRTMLPDKLNDIVLKRLELDPEEKANSITKEERNAIVHILKAFPLTITGTGEFKEAIITQGGVNVKEVDASTMESKLVPNLYFAGEVLDLDAFTGGFNLQIAFSTGYLAGISVR